VEIKMTQVVNPETAANIVGNVNSAATTVTDAVSNSTAVAHAADAVTGAANAAGAAVQKLPETAAQVVQSAQNAIPAGLMDKLGDGMLQMFDKAGEVLKQYGPDAIHGALMYVRIDGLVDVITGIIFLGVAGLIAYAVRRIWFPVLDAKRRSSTTLSLRRGKPESRTRRRMVARAKSAAVPSRSSWRSYFRHSSIRDLLVRLIHGTGLRSQPQKLAFSMTCIRA
jgi:phage-related protein